MPVIRAAIVSTGTEILHGLYADTNAQYLAAELGGMGYQVIGIAAAPDDEQLIVETMRGFFGRADFIISTGALGPTEDDNVREAVERLWGTPLAFDQRAWDMIGERLRRRNIEVASSNLKQAMIPTGAAPIYNNYGTAPGFALPGTPNQRPAIICLPGPPREMKPLFNEQVRDYLRKNFPPAQMQSVLQIHTAGLSESSLNDSLKDLFGAREDVTMGLLASGGLVRIRMLLRANSDAAMAQLREEMISEVQRRISPTDIWGYDDSTLEQTVGELLLRLQWTIAVAESCTGGLVNAALTRVPGASAYVKTGYVTYSNEAKMRLLGVREETLRQFGAVSEQTAAEMAQGARHESGSEVGAAITGIAGPSGGTEDKPVGLVCFGIATPAGTKTYKIQFPGERDLVRQFSSTRLLDYVRRQLLSEHPELTLRS